MNSISTQELAAQNNDSGLGMYSFKGLGMVLLRDMYIIN